MATIKRVGFGQVEPNHLSAQRTAQIYAQLPAAKDIKVLENGQFVKHDYAKKELGTLYNEIEFNKVIHSHGWCSYDVLEELVDEYIAEQKFIYGIK